MQHIQPTNGRSYYLYEGGPRIDEVESESDRSSSDIDELVDRIASGVTIEEIDTDEEVEQESSTGVYLQGLSQEMLENVEQTWGTAKTLAEARIILLSDMHKDPAMLKHRLAFIREASDVSKNPTVARVFLLEGIHYGHDAQGSPSDEHFLGRSFSSRKNCASIAGWDDAFDHACQMAILEEMAVTARKGKASNELGRQLRADITYIKTFKGNGAARDEKIRALEDRQRRQQHDIIDLQERNNALSTEMRYYTERRTDSLMRALAEIVQKYPDATIYAAGGTEHLVDERLTPLLERMGTPYVGVKFKSSIVTESVTWDDVAEFYEVKEKG